MEAIRETLTSGFRSCEVTVGAHEDYVDRYPRRSASSSGSHPPIKHSHYKNPDGRVFTLSPWPLDLYREWTRRIDRDHYVFGMVADQAGGTTGPCR